jgi:hypothetical protein
VTHGATVTGTIEFAGSPPTVGASAVLRVNVEEVTRADARANVVARQTVPAQLLLTGGREARRFSIAVADVESTKSYRLRIHLDLDGNGSIGQGDYVSTQSYPVITNGAPLEVIVTLNPV